jgi:hypothetical protein
MRRARSHSPAGGSGGARPPVLLSEAGEKGHSLDGGVALLTGGGPATVLALDLGLLALHPGSHGIAVLVGRPAEAVRRVLESKAPDGLLAARGRH